MRYQKAEMEILIFDAEEVITASSGTKLEEIEEIPGGGWTPGSDGVIEFP